MRAVIQRVARAEARVEGAVVGAVGPGLCILLGVARGDDLEVAKALAARVSRLRIFEEGGKFQRSVVEAGGGALVVSQFTLLADTSKGNRPGFAGAAPPEVAEPLYEAFCEALAAEGIRVERGVFGARMEVELVNDGPVTIVL